MNNIVIIIVSYNGITWLNKCLSSIDGKYPTVVVDNNSTDQTVKLIHEYFPQVKIIPQSENLGFGQANNRGISQALARGAEYIFLLNQDAYLKPNCIDNLIEIHQNNREYGILSPIHLNGDGTRLDKTFSNYLNYEFNKNFYSDYVLEKLKKEVYEVPFVNAAGWLISRECIEKVGGFDPIFFHYGEDDNFCQRVLYYNYNIGVVPTSFLKHDRENRKEEVEFSIQKKQMMRERKLKVEYANINKEYKNEIAVLAERARKKILTSYLKSRFKTAQLFKEEYKFLTRINSEIVRSREININENCPYI